MGVRITHPDRLWWPDEGIAKRDVVDYYRRVAPVLLPHLRDRPFTIKRHYTGPRSPYEWIKDAPPGLPGWIRTAPMPAKSRGGRPVRYVLVDDLDTLLWLIEFGAIDLHVGTSRIDRPDRPDFVLFDLDPREGSFEDAVEAALLVRAALETLGLDSVPMTTGGEGIHVRVPVERRHGHDETRGFCRAVAGALRSVAPELARRVRVDCKMNGHGQQVVAPYSVRPLPGAPVTAPIRWDEAGARLTMADVAERVERQGDLAARMLRPRQRLRGLSGRGRPG